MFGEVPWRGVGGGVGALEGGVSGLETGNTRIEPCPAAAKSPGVTLAELSSFSVFSICKMGFTQVPASEDRVMVKRGPTSNAAGSALWPVRHPLVSPESSRWAFLLFSGPPRL